MQSKLLRFCEPFFQARFTHLINCPFDIIPGQSTSISSESWSDACRRRGYAYEYFFTNQTLEFLNCVRLQQIKIGRKEFLTHPHQNFPSAPGHADASSCNLDRGRCRSTVLFTKSVVQHLESYGIMASSMCMCGSYKKTDRGIW